MRVHTNAGRRPERQAVRMGTAGEGQALRSVRSIPSFAASFSRISRSVAVCGFGRGPDSTVEV